ncbi:BFH_collapsed_G0021280.mRNA.1.CDS.1 [Saccharomyces cerevisiae]|nr:BFH_collapsed_G0021280.mRNA.1.CDS.1 [Saccharomyces cerevisiae]
MVILSSYVTVTLVFADDFKSYFCQGIFNMFSQSFESLPLATLINNDYLVMHGGLPSDPSATSYFCYLE